MKALTKDELDFLLSQGKYYQAPEWVGYQYITKDEKEYRARYAAMRTKLRKKGFIRITKKGLKTHSGYLPPDWDYTPLARQIVSFMQEKQRALDTLRNIRNAADNGVVELGGKKRKK